MLRDEIGKSGALRTMVDAVNAYVGNSLLCKRGCGVIWNTLISRKAEYIRGSQVVEGLLKILKVYVNDPYMCYSACGALVNVIRSDCK